MYILVALVLFGIGYTASLAGLLLDMKQFRASLGSNYLTRGDVVFAAMLAVIMPVGWLIGLKALIGFKVDWNAPAFRGDR